jgi:hypothetical protein
MSARKYGDFRDLEVWQQCREIRREVWLSDVLTIFLFD